MWLVPGFTTTGRRALADHFDIDAGVLVNGGPCLS
jgi:hypothetical protein